MLDIVKNPKYDEYQCKIVQIFTIFVVKRLLLTKEQELILKIDS